MKETRKVIIEDHNGKKYRFKLTQDAELALHVAQKEFRAYPRKALNKIMQEWLNYHALAERRSLTEELKHHNEEFEKEYQKFIENEKRQEQIEGVE